jgi:hypothetical protein
MEEKQGFGGRWKSMQGWGRRIEIWRIRPSVLSDLKSGINQDDVTMEMT